jgi:anti-anti-sigma factor
MSENRTAGLLEREDIGNVTVLRVKVPMLRGDEQTEALFQQAFSLVEEAGRSQLVLNLEGVVFLASMAIGRLVLLINKSRAARGRLTACRVSQTIGELLRMTHLADILLLYGDEQEAVRSFG